MAVLALLFNTLVWGVIWYPYRLLEQQGVPAAVAATATSLIAFAAALAVVAFAPRRTGFRPVLLAIAGTAGFANVAFIWASVHGEVVRVTLLFYLLPIWTALFARVVLGERLNGAGWCALGLGLSGAAFMLWTPALGLPWPKNLAEWMALAAGAGFGCSNVLLRKAHDISNQTKTAWLMGGNACMGISAMSLHGAGPTALSHALIVWQPILILGAALVGANLMLQYAIRRLAANQVALLSLFELVVVALTAWLWAGERMGWQEWSGGALIVSAGLLTLRPRTEGI